MAVLAWTITANGQSAAVQPAANAPRAIEAYLSMEGNFDSGTITWESRPIGGTNYNPVKAMAFTAEEGGVFLLHPGIEYRTSMAGVSSASDVDVTITRPNDVSTK